MTDIEPAAGAELAAAAGTTRLGLPYPGDADPAKLGAANIKALADATDALLVAKAGMPFLWVAGLAAVAMDAVYPFSTVVTDTHAGWNASAKAYKIPITGLYQIAVQTKTDQTGGYDEPCIETADTVTGSYGRKFVSGNPTNAPYNSMNLSGICTLTKDNGVRVREHGGAWAGYNTDSAQGSNYLQILFLGPL